MNNPFLIPLAIFDVAMWAWNFRTAVEIWA